MEQRPTYQPPSCLFAATMLNRRNEPTEEIVNISIAAVYGWPVDIAMSKLHHASFAWSYSSYAEVGSLSTLLTNQLDTNAIHPGLCRRDDDGQLFKYTKASKGY